MLGWCISRVAGAVPVAGGAAQLERWAKLFCAHMWLDTHARRMRMGLLYWWSTTRISTMDEATFWRLIEQSKQWGQGNEDQQISFLVDALVRYPEEEIIAFDVILNALMARSYRHDLWAAAYIINGGCSDDGFDYFRAWLIAQGQSIFNEALRNPESLVEVTDTDDNELEVLLYVARDAYARRTGRDMPLDHGGGWVLTGDDWDEDTVYELYPRLTAKFT